MKLKAGTYTFNDVLTEGAFEQSIDISVTADEDGTIATVRISKLGGVKIDYFGIIATYYSFVIDGEEHLSEELLVGIYSSSDNVWQIPQTHTITEDTEVTDDFGTWYIANTDYNTVNAITDLTGTTWNVPSGWSATSGFGQFAISGTLFDTDIKLLHIGYATHTDGSNVTTIFESKDVISATKIDDTMIYNILPESSFSLVITGGTDATNTALISWLQTYGELVSEETPEQPETPTKKFTRLYIGETVYSSNGKRFRKLQDTEYVEPSEPTLKAGLYDEDDNLVASWDTLVNTYGMNVEIGYQEGTSEPSCPINVLTNNSELTGGTKLIIGDVDRIGMHAFHKCVSLTSIVIPDSVVSIGNYAFNKCRALTSITIPNSVKTIGWQIFVYCSSLKIATLPSDITNIPWGTFESCANLESITIPNGVISIDNNAFYWCCYKLTNITIPASVASIGRLAFGNCEVLNNIIFEGTVAQWNAITFGEIWNYNAPAPYVQCTDGTVTL